MKNILFLALIFAFSCTSPQKYLEKKRYEKAFSTSLAQLKRDKSVEDNKRILQLALDQIVAQEFAKAATLVDKDKIKNGDKAVRLYKKLRKKIEKTAPYLGLAYQTQMDSLDYRNDELMKDLFDFYYARAQESLTIASETEKKAEAQNAYYDFAKAKKYGYQNEIDLVTPLQDEALELGIVYYYVEADAIFEITKQWEINRKFDDLDGSPTIFQRVYYDSNRNKENIDCAVEIDFKSLNFTIRESSDTEYFEKEIEDGYESVTDTAGNVTRTPIYRRIEALVTISTKTKTGTWEADVDVNHRTSNCDFSDARFDATVDSKIEVTEWQGDERAVPSRYKSAFRDEEFDSEDDMAEELIEDIYQQIKNYYF